MARPAKAFTVRWHDGCYTVRFSLPSQPRKEVSTGITDRSRRAEADRRGAEIYAAARAERKVRPAPDARPVVEPASEEKLSKCLANWTKELSDIRDVTRREYKKHAIRWLAEFTTLSGFTAKRIAGYVRVRLGEARGKTVRNESSALRKFLAWCVENEHLTAAPEVPALKASISGTPCKVRRRKKAPELSAEEIARFLDDLPEFSPRDKFAVRDRLIVAFETFLRPTTLDKIEVPANYSKGSSVLVVYEENDKEGYGREIPLTKKARDALDRHADKTGPIFGKHRYDRFVRASAKRTLSEPKANILCAQHLRSAGITRALERGGSLPGVAALSGHLHVSTTAIYVRSTTRAARDVVKLLDT